MMRKNMILVGKGTVITRDETKPLIKDGGVVLDGERIVKVGDYETLRSEYPQAELIDAKGQIIMPSLINMHEHIYSAPTISAGTIARTACLLLALTNQVLSALGKR